jgi:chromosome segregation ATPase
MADTDPVQAIRDAIEHLEAATAPVQQQIDEIERDARARVAELEEQIADQQKELKRWREALDRAEGREVRTTRGSRRSPALKIDDERLLRVLRDAGEPLSAGELRKALDIDTDVPAAQVTRLLGDAVERDVITRAGERRATRYAAP